jgi:nucleotide-binding universal stress UspA family protein
MFRHVIVGVDGRPAGRDAIALARMLVEPGGHLALGHVYELTAIRAVSGGFDDAAREASTRLLEQERDATGVEAELISVAASSAGRGLHELVESENADLLVVGSLPSRTALFPRWRPSTALADSRHQRHGNQPAEPE